MIRSATAGVPFTWYRLVVFQLASQLTYSRCSMPLLAMPWRPALAIHVSEFVSYAYPF